MKFSGFDWDSGNLEKCQKHGISAELIESVLDRPVAILPMQSIRDRNSACVQLARRLMSVRYLWFLLCAVVATTSSYVRSAIVTCMTRR